MLILLCGITSVLSSQTKIMIGGFENDVMWFTIIHIGLTVGLLAIVFFFYRHRLKSATKKILSQNEKLTLAIKAGEVMVWGYDKAKDLLYNIEGECVPEGEFRLDDLSKIIHEDDLDIILEEINSVLEGNSPKDFIVVRIMYPGTDEYSYVKKELMACRNSDGEIIGIIGTHKDVTATITKQTSLEAILKQYQKILESTSAELEIYDKNGNLLELNKNSDHKCLVKPAHRFADNVFVTPEILSGINKKRQFVITHEFECKRNDGKPNDIYYVEISIAPILDADNKLENIVLTFVDVTENMRATKNLTLLYKEQKEILETLPVGVVIFDINGLVEYANPMYCEIQGIADLNEYKKSNVSLFEKMTLGEDVKRKLRANEIGEVQQTIDYDSINLNNYFKTTNRGLKYLRVKYCNLKDENNNIRSYMLLISDITEEHKHKIDIDEKARKIELAIQASDLLQWDYNCDREEFSIIRFNGETSKMSVDRLKTLCHPDYIDKVLLIFEAMRKRQKIDINIEVCMLSVKQDGWHYVTITGAPLVHEINGIIQTYTGFRRDNTLWHRLTAQIKAQNDLNRIILDNMNAGLVYLDKNGRVISETVSEKFPLEYTGNLRLFEVGKLCKESGCHSFYPCAKCVVESVVESKGVATCEKKLDSGISLEVVGSPVFDGNGDVKNVVMKVENITARKSLYDEVEKLKNSAQESLQVLSEVIERIPSAIFLKDINDDYKYILCNRNFVEITGLSNDQMVGKTDYELYSKEIADKYRKDDIECATTGNVVEVDTETKENGVYKFWRIKKSKVRIANGRELIVAVGYDLSEIQETNRNLIAAKNKAEESDRLKSAFLANMSHEIRTPLNAIVGFSELIMNSDSNSDISEYNKIISTNNELLLRVINDILDLSKLDAGTVEIFRTEFDLVPYFNELESTIRLRMANNTDVSLIVENPCATFMVYFDKNRLTQIIMNFVTNAIKYTVKGHIKVGYQVKDNGVLFYVEDTGIGIADSKKDRVFQRFEKLDQFAQGTGLGLSICKALAELHGGKIGFESTEGVGSRFWMWKPQDCE